MLLHSNVLAVTVYLDVAVAVFNSNVAAAATEHLSRKTVAV